MINQLFKPRSVIEKLLNGPLVIQLEDIMTNINDYYRFKIFDNNVKYYLKKLHLLNHKNYTSTYKEMCNLTDEETAKLVFFLQSDLIVNHDNINEIENIFDKLIFFNLSNQQIETLFEKKFEKEINKQKSNKFNQLIKSKKLDKKGTLDFIAFGEERDIPEKDNEFEINLFDAIKNHFFSPGIETKYADEISKYLKQGLYQDIFPIPKVQKIYRGMSVTNSWLDTVTVRHQKGKIVKEFIWHPKANSSSWTKNLEIAKNFAISNADKNLNSVPIVMIAYVDNNEIGAFLDLIGWYKNITNEYSREREIMSLGNINVSEIILL